MHNRKKLSVAEVFVNILAYTIVVGTLIPLLWMLVTAFKPSGSPVNVVSSLFQPPFTTENFRYVFTNAPILRWTFNSLFVAVVVTGVVLIITSLAAYAFSQIHFRGRNIAFAMIMAGLMVPIEVTIVPLFLTMADQGILNSFISIMLPSFAAPLGVLILKNFYDGIPKELVEAATIDGAGPVRIFASIFVPLSRSSMAAVGIFTFISSWNNFLWPFLSINEEKMMTLPIGIPLFQGAYTMEMSIPMAANVVASVPAILVFILLQKHIIKGIAMTGIKG